jgi:ParB-like chromosome segregation protein Spo0J
MTILAHPLADLFPMMEGTALDELTADIKANGLRELIVLFEGKILDGRNRYAACLAAGIDLDECLTEYTGNDPRGFVISMNLHRRHLDQKQKRDLIEKVLRETPDHSDKRIADAVGVTDKTVTTVREKLESTSEIPKLERTIGKDGKSRPTKKKKRELPEPVITETSAVAPTDEDTTPDARGAEIKRLLAEGDAAQAEGEAEFVEAFKLLIGTLLRLRSSCPDTEIYSGAVPDNDLYEASTFLDDILYPERAAKKQRPMKAA